MPKITVYAVEVLSIGAEVHRVLEIPDTLEAMQGLVGGHLEYVVPEGIPEGIDMWINEEGRLIPLPEHPNPFWPDTIFGNYFLARHDSMGETTSLTPDDIKAIIKRVNEVGLIAAT